MLIASFLLFACPMQDRPSTELITAELRSATERGLDFLEAHQNRDGSFGTDAEDPDAHVGVTALAGLAFLAGGHAPGRGARGKASVRCLESVLSALDSDSGLIVTERTFASPMYSHAFATLYLAEAYGTSERDDVGRALRRAIDLIVSAQNPGGGWRYYPGSRDADLSVTACQVTALRAARNAGVAVPQDTIDRALAYVLACRNPDGAFRYQIEYGHATFQLTAAAVTCLQQLGQGDRPEVEAAFRWLDRYFPGGEEPVRGHFHYGQYYALQAAYARGPETFARWSIRVRDRLLSEQAESGAFPEATVGDLYGTAMALLVLQLPYHFLPVLIR